MVAKVTDADGKETSLSADDLIGAETRDGHVGLTAYNCGGVAFDNVMMSPNERESDLSDASSFLQSAQTMKPW